MQFREANPLFPGDRVGEELLGKATGWNSASFRGQGGRVAPLQDLLFLTTAPVGIELLQSHPGHRANRRLPSPSHETAAGTLPRAVRRRRGGAPSSRSPRCCSGSSWLVPRDAAETQEAGSVVLSAESGTLVCLLERQVNRIGGGACCLHSPEAKASSRPADHKAVIP